jgi:hypothetical protein
VAALCNLLGLVSVSARDAIAVFRIRRDHCRRRDRNGIDFSISNALFHARPLAVIKGSVQISAVRRAPIP